MEVKFIPEHEIVELPTLPEPEVETVSLVVALERGWITDREATAWMRRASGLNNRIVRVGK